MPSARLKTITAMTLFAALAGCVEDPALVQSGAAGPAPKTFPDAYVAKQDGSVTLPAIPLEKVPDAYERQTVAFPGDDAPGTIIINPGQRTLHLVVGKNKAIRYGIAVGRAGFEWSGEAVIASTQQWPKWFPPKEMIARKPELAQWENGQPGGLQNPLGARALYLTSGGKDYGYRIHGTPEWNTIGSNASSGCIRMINQDVIDLYQRAPVGTKVIVLNADGSRPTALNLPPPQSVKKVAPAKPAVVPAATEPDLPELPAPPPLDAALITAAAGDVAPPASMTASN
jgi:lipoprotein-anchoring transpeptidase ErfK/SrfK